MTYCTWKTTNPEDEQLGSSCPQCGKPGLTIHYCSDEQIDNDPPCKHETFSGVCMICDAGPDEPCKWED